MEKTLTLARFDSEICYTRQSVDSLQQRLFRGIPYELEELSSNQNVIGFEMITLKETISRYDMVVESFHPTSIVSNPAISIEERGIDQKNFVVIGLIIGIVFGLCIIALGPQWTELRHQMDITRRST